MLIDSHCHFDFEPFASDPAYYLELARSAGGVGKIIIPSVGERNWQTVRLSASSLTVYTTHSDCIRFLARNTVQMPWPY